MYRWSLYLIVNKVKPQSPKPLHVLLRTRSLTHQRKRWHENKYTPKIRILLKCNNSSHTNKQALFCWENELAQQAVRHNFAIGVLWRGLFCRRCSETAFYKQRIQIRKETKVTWKLGYIATLVYRLISLTPVRMEHAYSEFVLDDIIWIIKRTPKTRCWCHTGLVIVLQGQPRGWINNDSWLTQRAFTWRKGVLCASILLDQS